MLEKRFAAVPAQIFTVNGTADGTVTIADTSLFKVKQHVIVTATGQINLELEIKKITSQTTMIVGPVAGNVNTFTDVSAYTTSASGSVFANEQKRPIISVEEANRAIYEEEPTVAQRVVMVDKHGEIYDDTNPLPATFSGSISVGVLNQGNPNTLGSSWPVKITDGTNVLGTHANPLEVAQIIIPYPSVGFNTMTPLGVGAVFTGPAENVETFVNADVTVISDQASANDGLIFSWSQDNVLFDYSEAYTVVPNVGQTFSLFARAKYFKVTYTNGGIAQGTFQLSVVYYTTSRSTYTHNADLDIPAGNSVDVVKSILAAEKDQGNANAKYTNLKATSDGILKVAVQTKTSPSTAVPIIVHKANMGPVLTGSTISRTLPGSVVAGNTIIVMVLQGNGTLGASYQMGDSKGNNYTRAGGVNIIGTGSVDVWYAQDVLAGSTIVNVFNISTPINMAIQIYEVSGLPLSSNPVANLTAGLSVTPITSLSSGTVATATNNELLISAFAASGGGILTSGAGWTQDLSTANFLVATEVVPNPISISGVATASSAVTYIGLLTSFLPATNSLPLITDINGVLITNSRSQDGLGNLLTSQISGSQRALDIGIDVAGIQIDPRNIRPLTSSDVVSVTGSLTDTELRSAPVPVTVVSGTTTADGLTIAHSEITSVVAGSETVLLTSTAPLGGQRITKAEVSGDNIALFRIKVDGITVIDKRTWWTNFNQTFAFEDFNNGLLLTAGQVLTITVFHNSDDVGSFEATLMSI